MNELKASSTARSTTSDFTPASSLPPGSNNSTISARPRKWRRLPRPGGTITRTITVSTDTSAGASTKFAMGHRVQATGDLNVRSAPSTSGTLLGTQAAGALGTVVGGPVEANGYWWWQIDYDNAPDGWSVENRLQAY